jgi:hypothetical protein
VRRIPNTPPATVDGWFEWTLANYLPHHFELFETEKNGRGVGIQALAEAMAALNGKTAAAMGGTASEVAKRIRAECKLKGGKGTGVTGGGVMQIDGAKIDDN